LSVQLLASLHVGSSMNAWLTNNTTLLTDNTAMDMLADDTVNMLSLNNSLLNTAFVADEGLGDWGNNSLSNILDDGLFNWGDDLLGNWGYDSLFNILDDGLWNVFNNGSLDWDGDSLLDWDDDSSGLVNSDSLLDLVNNGVWDLSHDGLLDWGDDSLSNVGDDGLLDWNDDLLFNWSDDSLLDWGGDLLDDFGLDGCTESFFVDLSLVSSEFLADNSSTGGDVFIDDSLFNDSLVNNVGG